jgi:adenylyl-sulfate kinase
VQTITISTTPAAPTLWFTGLSSAGKTTLGHSVCSRLVALGHKVQLLDGDVVREHICNDLGFTKRDRHENIRRIGFLASMLTRHGVVVVVSAISPYRDARNEMRNLLSPFIEIYVNAPISVCEERDVKGLYRRARAGEIRSMTGIDDPYEPPEKPEVECCTHQETLTESTDKVLTYFSHMVCPRNEIADLVATPGAQGSLATRSARQ